mmetsp:Transcript_33670/g.51994  ORF Transcript_33670/g.51994 Transcript_33670/m.51994 type:complete len:257 (-) Transcript_33670:1586-2356(-)
MIALSYYRKRPAVKLWSFEFYPITVGMFALLLVLGASLYKNLDIFSDHDREARREMSLVTTQLVAANIANYAILSHVYPKQRTLMVAVFITIVLPAVILRTFSVSEMKERIPYLVQLTIIYMGYFIMFFFSNNSLINWNQEYSSSLSKSLREVEAINKLQEEMRDLLESLDLGIVEVKNGSVSFMNLIFKQILNQVEGWNGEDANIKKKLLDLKIFRLFRSDSSQSIKKSTSSIARDDMVEGSSYSMRYLLSLQQD